VLTCHQARKGAKVYLAARSPQKAMAAIEELKKEKLKGKIEFLHLDLKDPKGVKAATKKFLEEEDRLDILGEYIQLMSMNKLRC
jgi:NAD(P)-dependent dehydrogenase (short-subunit alcohol dehydrogenase family)